jgi:hypothetical protein
MPERSEGKSCSVNNNLFSMSGFMPLLTSETTTAQYGGTSTGPVLLWGPGHAFQNGTMTYSSGLGTAILSVFGPMLRTAAGKWSHVWLSRRCHLKSRLHLESSKKICRFNCRDRTTGYRHMLGSLIIRHIKVLFSPRMPTEVHTILLKWSKNLAEPFFSWENSRKIGFKDILGCWIWIWSQLIPGNSRSAAIKFIVFDCPEL